MLEGLSLHDDFGFTSGVGVKSEDFSGLHHFAENLKLNDSVDDLKQRFDDR